MLDHDITYELRARVAERQQKDATNDKKRITNAPRGTQVGSDGSTGAVVQVQGQAGMVDIENRVGGYFPVVGRHMAQQGIEVLGWDDWAQAVVFVVFRLEA